MTDINKLEKLVLDLIQRLDNAPLRDDEGYSLYLCELVDEYKRDDKDSCDDSLSVIAGLRSEVDSLKESHRITCAAYDKINAENAKLETANETLRVEVKALKALLKSQR